MKKILYVFSFILLALGSCSKDDNAPAVSLNPNTLLLKKTVSRNYAINSAELVTTFWNYDGMKLLSTIDSNGFRRNYTYTGNLITKIEEINGDFVQSYLLAYDEDRLVAISGNQPETFDYNEDGTVTHKLYDSNATVQWTAIISFNNAEISKIETTYADSFATTYQYSYDNKFSPTKNITGFDKIYLTMHYPYGSYRNLTERSYTDSDGVQGEVTKAVDYNAVGFPIMIKSTDDQFIESFDTQLFYQ